MLQVQRPRYHQRFSFLRKLPRNEALTVVGHAGDRNPAKPAQPKNKMNIKKMITLIITEKRNEVEILSDAFGKKVGEAVFPSEPEVELLKMTGYGPVDLAAIASAFAHPVPPKATVVPKCSRCGNDLYLKTGYFGCGGGPFCKECQSEL